MKGIAPARHAAGGRRWEVDGMESTCTFVRSTNAKQSGGHWICTGVGRQHGAGMSSFEDEGAASVECACRLGRIRTGRANASARSISSRSTCKDQAVLRGNTFPFSPILCVTCCIVVYNCQARLFKAA
eukprot:522527-Pleurochrysis_carterae.AAC.1